RPLGSDLRGQTRRGAASRPARSRGHPGRVFRAGRGTLAYGATMTDTTKYAAGCALESPSTEDRNRCAPDDVALLERIRAGDEGACEALVRQHGGRMLAVARRFLRTEEDSADAVQDAFLSAFRSLDGFEGNSALGTWLHRIVVNVCLTRLRAQSRSREVRIDELLPTFDETGHHRRPVRPWDHQTLARLTQAETRT